MEPSTVARCPLSVLRWIVMLGLSAGLAVSATWAASFDMPDTGLPQPRLADTPEDIALLPCGELKRLRLRVARRELDITILRLLELNQTDQVRRVLAYRRQQLALVREMDMRTEREARNYPCAGR